MLQQRTHNTPFRFKRFANKAYAAFASLHKEVTIGTVRRHICDRELLKAGKTNVITGPSLTSADFITRGTDDCDTDYVAMLVETMPANAINRTLPQPAFYYITA